jgi:hypothetical protein
VREKYYWLVADKPNEQGMKMYYRTWKNDHCMQVDHY